MADLRLKLERTHTAAMLAKESIFRAQDALSLAWTAHAETEERFGRDAARKRLLCKMEKRLARCRAELEQLDNEWLAYCAAGEDVRHG